MQPQMQRRPIVRPLDGAGGRKRTLPRRGGEGKKTPTPTSILWRPKMEVGVAYFVCTAFKISQNTEWNEPGDPTTPWSYYRGGHVRKGRGHVR